jgi:hypothetical protein
VGEINVKSLAKTTLVALALVHSAGGVQAATYNWGTHAVVETSFAAGGGAVGAGSFVDTYLFSLTSPATQQSSVAVAINLFDFSISNGAYSLFSTTDYGAGTPQDDAKVGGNWSFNGKTGFTVHSLDKLATGNYYFAVSGVGGSEGGRYVLSSAVVTAPVPEPEIYAMLGIGFGLLGWMRRRRGIRAA